MCYTTITVVPGFSALAFSNFVPTIYFGVVTGIAMIAALVADLTLMPVLLKRYRPDPGGSSRGFGPAAST